MDMLGFVLTTRDMWLLGICGSLALAWLVFLLNDTLNKMKDFNTAADILDAILRKERHGPMPESNINFDAFRRVLNKRELIRFDRCVEEYHQAKRNAEIVTPNDTGNLIRVGSTGWYHDANPIVLAIDELLKFTKRK